MPLQTLYGFTFLLKPLCISNNCGHLKHYMINYTTTTTGSNFSQNGEVELNLI